MEILTDAGAAPIDAALHAMATAPMMIKRKTSDVRMGPLCDLWPAEVVMRTGCFQGTM